MKSLGGVCNADVGAIQRLRNRADRKCHGILEKPKCDKARVCVWDEGGEAGSFLEGGTPDSME